MFGQNVIGAVCHCWPPPLPRYHRRLGQIYGMAELLNAIYRIVWKFYRKCRYAMQQKRRRKPQPSAAGGGGIINPKFEIVDLSVWVDFTVFCVLVIMRFGLPFLLPSSSSLSSVLCNSQASFCCGLGFLGTLHWMDG
jgi:hypothetical protein